MLKEKETLQPWIIFPSEDGLGHSTECSSFKFCSSIWRTSILSWNSGGLFHIGQTRSQRKWWRIRALVSEGEWQGSQVLLIRLSYFIQDWSPACKGCRGTGWGLRYFEAWILCPSSEKFDCLFTNSIATCDAKDIIPVTVSVGVCVSFDMNGSTFFCKE